VFLVNLRQHAIKMHRREEALGGNQ